MRNRIGQIGSAVLLVVAISGCQGGESGNTKANSLWQCGRSGCTNTGNNDPSGGGSGGSNSGGTIASIVVPPPAGNPSFPTVSNYGQAVSAPLLDAPYQTEAITYALKYGPVGMTISSSGIVTWNSQDFMPDQKMDFNWGVDIVYKNQNFSYQGKISVSDTNRKYPLAVGSILVPKQEHSLIVDDFDNDGKKEVLLTDNQNSVQVLSYNVVTSRYEVLWQYPYPISITSNVPEIYSVAAVDLNGDSFKEFIVVSLINFQSGTKFTVIDGLTKRKVSEISDGKRYIGCEVTKLTSSSSMGEMICLSASGGYTPLRKLHVLALSTFNTIWESSNIDHGPHFQIGNIDSDAQSEIVTSSGHIYDGATFVLENQYVPGFGISWPFRLGNVNGDLRKEIIFSSGNNSEYIRVLDGSTLQVTGTLTNANNTEKSWILVGNLDSDAFDEVISMSSQNFGDVYGFDDLVASGTQTWLTSLRTQYDAPRLYPLIFADTDNDGLQDLVVSEESSTGIIVLGADNGISGPKFRFDGRERWASGYGSVTGGFWANTNAGKRIVFAVNSGWQPYGQYTGARFAYIDGVTGTYSYSNTLSHYSMYFNTAILDSSGVDKIFFSGQEAAATQGAGYLLFQAGSHSPQQLSPVSTGATSRIVSADLNSDTRNDFLFVASNSTIIAYDVYQNSVIWNSGVLSAPIADIDAADLDGDGKNEILALSGSKVSVFERPNGVFQSKYIWENSMRPQPFSNLYTADVDADGNREVVLVNKQDSVGYVFSSNMQTLIGTINFNNDALSSYYVVDSYVDQSSQYNKGILVASSENSPGPDATTMIKYFDLRSGREVWRMGPVLGLFSKGSMRFADIDGDGKLKLIYGTSRSMNVTR